MRAKVDETTAPPTTESTAPRTLARLLPQPRPAPDLEVLRFRTSLFAPLRFGHVLGLGDEYGYTDIPGAHPGDPLNDPEYERMDKEQTGDLVRTSDESMMSKGGTIRPWHYSPFLEALKRIAGPTWRLR